MRRRKARQRVTCRLAPFGRLAHACDGRVGRAHAACRRWAGPSTVRQQQLRGVQHGLALLRHGERGHALADQPHRLVPAIAIAPPVRPGRVPRWAKLPAMPAGCANHAHFRRPVGWPSACRPSSPPCGSGVSACTPHRLRAASFAHAMWPSTLLRYIGCVAGRSTVSAAASGRMPRLWLPRATRQPALLHLE